MYHPLAALKNTAPSTSLYLTKGKRTKGKLPLLSILMSVTLRPKMSVQQVCEFFSLPQIFLMRAGQKTLGVCWKNSQTCCTWWLLPNFQLILYCTFSLHIRVVNVLSVRCSYTRVLGFRTSKDWKIFVSKETGQNSTEMLN